MESQAIKKCHSLFSKERWRNHTRMGWNSHSNRLRFIKSLSWTWVGKHFSTMDSDKELLFSRDMTWIERVHKKIWDKRWTWSKNWYTVCLSTFFLTLSSKIHYFLSFITRREQIDHLVLQTREQMNRRVISHKKDIMELNLPSITRTSGGVTSLMMQKHKSDTTLTFKDTKRQRGIQITRMERQLHWSRDGVTTVT